MTININKLNTNNQVQQTQQKQVQQQSAQTASTGAQVKNSGQDSVSITPQAKQLNELLLTVKCYTENISNALYNSF